MDRSSSKKRSSKKDSQKKKHKHSNAMAGPSKPVITSPSILDDIEWSDVAYSPIGLMEKGILSSSNLPLIVRVASSERGLNLIDDISLNQIILLKGWEKQNRILVRDKHRRLLSFPLNWPIKFKVKKGTWSRSKPKTLTEIAQQCALPVHVYFDKLHKWKFHAGQREVTNFRFGGLDLVQAHTEYFLMGMPIRLDGKIVDEAKKMSCIPAYTKVRFQIAKGFRGKGIELFEKLKQDYLQDIKTIDLSKMYGSEDALLYSSEYIDVNHRFVYSLSGSNEGKTRLTSQDFGSKGRLVHNMSASLKSTEKSKDNLDMNYNVKQPDSQKNSSEDGTAKVFVEQNGAVATANITAASVSEGKEDLYAKSSKHSHHGSSEIEIQVNKETDAEEEPTEKPTTKETSIQNTIDAEINTHSPSTTQSKDSGHVESPNNLSPTSADRPGLVDLRDIPSGSHHSKSKTHGSNENLHHDEDAQFSAPWGFMGGRYRSVVTVSNAGSDIVSDYGDEPDFGHHHHHHKSKHMSLPRKELHVNTRYGGVAPESTQRRKVYVTRSVTDVRPSTTRRSYSLSRVQGAGPMRYFMPGETQERPISHQTRSVIQQASPRQRSHTLSSSGGSAYNSSYSTMSHRGTMSEVNAPTYRRSRHYALRTDIPEENYDYQESYDYQDGYIGRQVSLSPPTSPTQRVFVDRNRGYSTNDKYYQTTTSEHVHKQQHRQRTASAPRYVGRPTHKVRQNQPPSYATYQENSDQVYVKPTRTYEPPHTYSLDRGRSRMSRAQSQGQGSRVYYTERKHQPMVDLRGNAHLSSSIVDVSSGTINRRTLDNESRSDQRRPHSSAMEQHILNSSYLSSDEETTKVYRRFDVAAVTKLRTQSLERPLRTMRSVEITGTDSDDDQTLTRKRVSKERKRKTNRRSYDENHARQLEHNTSYIANAEHHEQAKLTPVEASKNGQPNYVASEQASKQKETDHVQKGNMGITTQNQFEDISKNESTATSKISEKSVSSNTTIPSPPPPPPLPPVIITSAETYTETSHTVSSSKMHSSNTMSHNAQNEPSDLHSVLQNELKSKFAQRNGNKTEQDNSHLLIPKDQDPGVQMRSKSPSSISTKESKDYRANSLRQVYKHRASLDNITDSGVLSVTKSNEHLEEILNKNESESKVSDAHDTLKSSGYGSVSSKPEARSTISSPYLQPLPTPTKTKHMHSNLDNPWALADAESEGKQQQNTQPSIRESIMSIQELDEYLKSQSIGIESDDDVSRHFEDTEICVAEMELTHL